MLRGNFAAKIDSKGRLKVPAAFRYVIEEKFGDSVFLTSLTGESVRIYPMPVWSDIEEKLARIPSAHPSRTRFFDRVNFFGQPAQIDKQGRVSVHVLLRETASMVGEVSVFGLYNYLEVWNHDRIRARLERDPFTDEDARALAEFGI